MRLTDFKALTFDCYGTLIDWETGIATALQRVVRAHGIEATDRQLVDAFGRHEHVVEEESFRVYRDVLAETLVRLVADFGTIPTLAERQAFSASVGDWPAFPDSADALARLAWHYKLIIVSNVHRAGFAGSNRQLRGDFAAIITAEDVGAYKPAENHFRALDARLPALGVDRRALLHVAQSLFHDHVPAKREGLPSVWINRRHDRPGRGATPEPTDAWAFAAEFTSMAGFADAVDAAFAGT